MADHVTFEIDDAKSVAGNQEALKAKLRALDPELGAMLATFLPQLTRDPAGDKTAMLIALRAELDKAAADEAAS